MIISEKNVIIVDYKTGEKDKNHKEQVLKYMKIYTKMDYNVKGYILYLDDEPLLIEVEYE